MSEHELRGCAGASGIHVNTSVETEGETQISSVMVQVHILGVSELFICGLLAGIYSAKYRAVAREQECHPLTVTSEAHSDFELGSKDRGQFE
jgi:hypothetical protein